MDREWECLTSERHGRLRGLKKVRGLLNYHAEGRHSADRQIFSIHDALLVCCSLVTPTTFGEAVREIAMFVVLDVSL